MNRLGDFHYDIIKNDHIYKYFVKPLISKLLSKVSAYIQTTISKGREFWQRLKKMNPFVLTLFFFTSNTFLDAYNFLQNQNLSTGSKVMNF